jgi:hypothetical protein
MLQSPLARRYITHSSTYIAIEDIGISLTRWVSLGDWWSVFSFICQGWGTSRFHISIICPTTQISLSCLSDGMQRHHEYLRWLDWATWEALCCGLARPSERKSKTYAQGFITLSSTPTVNPHCIHVHIDIHAGIIIIRCSTAKHKYHGSSAPPTHVLSGTHLPTRIVAYFRKLWRHTCSNIMILPRNACCTNCKFRSNCWA